MAAPRKPAFSPSSPAPGGREPLSDITASMSNTGVHPRSSIRHQALPAPGMIEPLETGHPPAPRRIAREPTALTGFPTKTRYQETPQLSDTIQATGQGTEPKYYGIFQQLHRHSVKTGSVSSSIPQSRRCGEPVDPEDRENIPPLSSSPGSTAAGPPTSPLKQYFVPGEEDSDDDFGPAARRSRKRARLAPAEEEEEEESDVEMSDVREGSPTPISRPPRCHPAASATHQTLPLCSPSALLRPTARASSYGPTAFRPLSVSEMLLRRQRGERGVGPSRVSTLPILRTFASNSQKDVFKCPSQSTGRDWVPPFACSFTNSARNGGRQILAVADEEGMISLLNADQSSDWDREHGRPTLSAHQNAIFDVSWSSDDRRIATASGDQTVKVWDVSSTHCLSTAVGHTASVKQVAWDPNHHDLFATASRDGSILVFDMRLPCASPTTHLQPVIALSSAHSTPRVGNPRGRARASKGRSATRSVTSIAYLGGAPCQLISAGSGDGCVKLWDLRFLEPSARSGKSRPRPRKTDDPSHRPAVEVGLDPTIAGGATGKNRRPHGISSLCVTERGEKAWALSTDGCIYPLNPLALSSPHPPTPFQPPFSQGGGSSLTHPDLSVRSFYVRLALSPCERFLACGSSGGGVALWDAGFDGTLAAGHTPAGSAVWLKGHGAEVGSLAWGRDVLATTSDDLTVRLWRPNRAIAERRCATSVDGVKWEDEWQWTTVAAATTSRRTDTAGWRWSS